MKPTKPLRVKDLTDFVIDSSSIPKRRPSAPNADESGLVDPLDLPFVNPYRTPVRELDVQVRVIGEGRRLPP